MQPLYAATHGAPTEIQLPQGGLPAPPRPSTAGRHPDVQHPSPQHLHHVDELSNNRRNMELESRERDITDRDARLGRRENEIADRDTRLGRRENELADQDARLGRRENELADQDARLGRRENELADREAERARRENELADHNVHLSRRERELAEREAGLAARERELEEAQQRIRDFENSTREALQDAQAVQHDLTNRFGSAEGGREDLFLRHEADRQRLFEESEDRRRAEAEARRQAIFNMQLPQTLAQAQAQTVPTSAPPVAPPSPSPPPTVHIAADPTPPPSPPPAPRQFTPPPVLAAPPVVIPEPVPVVVDLSEHRQLLEDMAEQMKAQMAMQLEEMRQQQIAAQQEAAERELRLQELFESAFNRQNEGERVRIETLEAELAKAREQQESDRMLREQELTARLDRDSDMMGENFESVRNGLGDITNLIRERDHADMVLRETLDARYAEKDGRRMDKEAKQGEMLGLISRIIQCCDEMRDRDEDDRALANQRTKAFGRILDPFLTRSSHRSR